MEGLQLEEDNETAEQLLYPMRNVRVWYLAVVLNPLYILGILGDILSVVVFMSLGRRRQNRHCGLLCCLGLADGAYLLLMLEYTWTVWGLPFFELGSNALCAGLFYVRGVAGTSASLFLVVICMARLLVFNNGPKFRINSALGVVTACLVAVFANIPRLVSFRLRGGEVPCRSHHESQLSTVMHMAAHLLFQRLGPAILVCLLSALLLIRIRKMLHPINRYIKQQIRLTKACIILGITYTIFVLPPGIYWCLIYYWEISHSVPMKFIHFHSIIGDMVSVTAALNSAINFPIYLFFLDDFRRFFYKMTAKNGQSQHSSSTSFELRTLNLSME